MSKRPLPREARLGVPQMDAEHSFQITLLHALQDAAAGADPKEALELIDQLDEFTVTHFLSEEILMRERAYPDHQAHRLEHDRLIGELRGLRDVVRSRADKTPLIEAEAIEQWLLRHIQSFDAALAAFITRTPAPMADET